MLVEVSQTQHDTSKASFTHVNFGAFTACRTSTCPEWGQSIARSMLLPAWCLGLPCSNALLTNTKGACKWRGRHPARRRLVCIRVPLLTCPDVYSTRYMRTIFDPLCKVLEARTRRKEGGGRGYGAEREWPRTCEDGSEGTGLGAQRGSGGSRRAFDGGMTAAHPRSRPHTPSSDPTGPPPVGAGSQASEAAEVPERGRGPAPLRAACQVRRATSSRRRIPTLTTCPRPPLSASL